MERLVIQDATVHRGGRWRTLLGNRECGSESVARRALGRDGRASEETSLTACVHVDDAHERSSTPDDHETERSSEWIRNLETFPGRVGASTQRTVPSDADAVVAVSVLRETEVKPWRSGNDLCDSMRHRVQTRFRTRSKQKYWHTTHKIQNGGGTLDWTRRGCRGTWKAMHQAYRQWGIADGNDSTQGS